MINYKKGDMFSEDVEALVNSVNCVGVMGRGIALQFKNLFPDNFRAYEHACKRDEVQPGQMFVFETRQLTGPRYVINFPTKRHWRGRSRMEDIQSGLSALAQEIRERDIRSIALPPLGTGLGGLEWTKVRLLIQAELGELQDLRVVVFEPGGMPSDRRSNRSTKVPTMTKGKAALVELMDRYLQSLLDPFLTLLELHKLMYFMEKAGEPLKLNFKKAYYGPYSEKLGHVLRPLEGHLISGYEDGGDMPWKRIELVPGAVKDAEAFLNRHPRTRQRLTRVSELVEGFESSFGLELLATVHWVALNHDGATDDEVIAETHAWSFHKWRFSEDQILLALRVLREKGWLN